MSPSLLRSLRQSVTLLGLLVVAATVRADVQIGIVRTASWSLGDEVREGAGEFLVLLEGAKLQKAGARCGLIVVGNRRGVLQSGGERALRRLACSGMIVVRVAAGGEVTAIPDALHVDAGELTPEVAQQRLAEGLERYGPAPAPRDPGHPTPAELAAIQAHLKQLQPLFGPRADDQVAVRSIAHAEQPRT